MSLSFPAQRTARRPRLQDQHDPYFVQQVQVSSELVGLPREHVFRQLLAGKRVLHVGYADWPITDLRRNLHVALDEVCAVLDGVDPHDEAAAAIRPHVRGKLLRSIGEVTDAYDVVLVPEVLEHVGDVEAFLAELSTVDASSVLITVPDAYSCARGHFEHDEESGVFTEVVHPDHNYWFTPYTLTNTIRKYTDWRIDGVWFFNRISLLLLASRPVPGVAPQAAAQPVPAEPPLDLPGPAEAVAAARAEEYDDRAAATRQRIRLAPLVPRQAPAASQGLHLCYLMPRTDIGGGARVLLEHATRLTALGCRVTVLSHFPEPTWHPFSGEFVRVPFGVELTEALPACDVVVAGYWDQVLAARATGVAPVVHLEQGDAHLFEPAPEERERVVRACLAAADRTVTLSAANARILSDRYGTDADVVPNAVDPDVFGPRPAPAPSVPYLLVVGWDGNAFKGVDDADRAWQQLRAQGRDLDLVWVTPRPPLQPRGRVVVAPEQHELAELYRGAAAYVHASRYESFPLPPLEAMACGGPVVATRNRGVVEYAEDGENCLLVDVGDVDGLRDAVARLLDDPALAARVRAGGLRTAQRHDWPTIAGRLLATYRQLAGSAPQRGPREAWRVDLAGLTPASDEAAALLDLRLRTSTASRLAVPVVWPAFEGHEVGRWRVVAQREVTQREDPADSPAHDRRVERVFVPHRADGPPADLPYAGALHELTTGRPDRALGAFVQAYQAAEDLRERAALGRWVVLALLEAGRDDEALAVACSGVDSHPGYSDYHYLAAVVGGLLGRPVDLGQARETAALLGPGSRYGEWFHDTAGLLDRQLRSAA